MTSFIPIDIADTISHNLTQKQIGSCRSVCRTWEYIFTCPLYRHVQIKGRKQFDLFYQSLFSIIRPGLHIRRLKLDDISLTEEELDQLTVSCPHLVEFIYEGKTISPVQNTTRPQWRRLRRLSEQHDVTLACNLLDSSSCHLTQLSVSFSDEDKSHLLPLLANAKQLKSLYLGTLQLSCTELEHIHHVCPHLTHLRLFNTQLGEDMTIHDITPSKTMTSFEFQNGSGLDNLHWLHYFQYKYPNLTHLCLWNKDSLYTTQIPTPQLHTYYHAMADLIGSLTRLTSAEFFKVLMNEWAIQAMHLDRLALSDMTDYTLYLLDILPSLRSLTLWGWSSLCIPGVMKEALTRVGHRRLEHFHFTMAHSGVTNVPLGLDVLLDTCGSLQSVTLEGVQLVLTHCMDMVREAVGRHPLDFPRPHLRRLTMRGGAFNQEAFEYLAYRCPGLRDLEIEASVNLMGTTISMPHHQFDTLSLGNIHTPRTVYKRFEIRQRGQSRYYEVMEGHIVQRECLLSPVFVFECQSVTNVYLDGFWVNF